MNSIILFYKYVDLECPQQILAWQKRLCASLQLKGRVIIAHEGINGTLGGLHQNIEIYKKAMLEHPLFSDVDFKQSIHTGDHFPRLRIVIKNEIVYLGLDTKTITAAQAGIHLEPAQAHALIQKKPDDLIIIDCRNKTESAIGRIEEAIIPDVHHFRDFPAYVDKHLNDLKDKQVLMYCTGGVRCERASAYIKLKGVAKNVYHIKGGIHNYVEQFPHGFFKGKNYVFDGRTAVKVTDDILGTCFICATPCDDYTNCMRAGCNRHFIGCAPCLTQYKNTCGIRCHNEIAHHNAPLRPQPKKEYAGNENPHHA